VQIVVDFLCCNKLTTFPYDEVLKVMTAANAKSKLKADIKRKAKTDRLKNTQTLKEKTKEDLRNAPPPTALILNLINMGGGLTIIGSKTNV
jgi:hypothetical protein